MLKKSRWLFFLLKGRKEKSVKQGWKEYDAWWRGPRILITSRGVIRAQTVLCILWRWRSSLPSFAPIFFPVSLMKNTVRDTCLASKHPTAGTESLVGQCWDGNVEFMNIHFSSCYGFFLVCSFFRQKSFRRMKKTWMPSVCVFVCVNFSLFINKDTLGISNGYNSELSSFSMSYFQAKVLVWLNFCKYWKLKCSNGKSQIKNMVMNNRYKSFKLLCKIW